MSEEALALERVSKRYGTQKALDRVTFSLAAGEAVGYLGPNGAGKSTTLKLLAGLAAPDEGAVRVLGRAPRSDGGSPLARVGALIETPGLPPFVHGRDVLEYIAEARSIPASERPAAAHRAAEELGLEGRLDGPVGGLSTGLLRRLLVAGALVGDPDVLLLDEPTLGLDPIGRHDLRTTLKRLLKQGRTLLLSTHLLDDVEGVCQRAVFLRDGRVVGDAPVGPPVVGAEGRRTIQLTFVAALDARRLESLLGPDEHLEEHRGASATVSLVDDDRRQAALLARLWSGDVGIVSAEPRRRGLAELYLSTVGREESG